MCKRKLLLLPLFLFPLVIILTQCLSTKKEITDPRGAAYAGAKTCISCHSSIAGSYLHTAHNIASSPASAQSIHGSFSPGFNSVIYNNHTKLLMTTADSGYYQTNFVNGQKVESARIDIAMGGVKGETYLYWKQNELFQLPVSFDNTNNRWIVSPGYDTTIASFDRMINIRCMECHASYAKTEQGLVPSFGGNAIGFDKASVILGIDCERCHGSAKQHADFQTANPTVKTAKYIIRISKLTRGQKTDLCGTCHSGTQTINSKSIFGFTPGDKLTDYKKHEPNAGPLDLAHMDVHGDQLDMLKTSKCYISSKMDCNTCHNTHRNERGSAQLFARRCQSCHSSTGHNIVCKMANQLDAKILQAKCISCHMPALPSKAIVNQQKPVMIHTHHIGIYPDEIARLTEYLKKK
ncbi:multiheme c-type cytochrome [Mucilaginibacter phyllosphaerae]|uniref:Cytochrome c-552/4 domain-containing protein n=1 Tax=Mucilaginibacter phyllosphaerae TaxID=1812349 RepID=A0A4Y8AJ08_9SPHI|nr:multiheme c-type cytochrome [Mucilaginibacter phyllosphaerae]MBB3967924.1 hypothetical protein [Mucilaginibacter phyllosphaerae]TEW69037.1 hypothetical protein E2R65_02410 [Mucilaginibacter phyllosphaerae]GGH02380.1 hypothetical protein GCM10007352_04600 [Mucilaginibacter phyllosphaerae]